ncbi:hypothetical protein J6W34_09320 [bacterium]|nr:hypothetical protein [bacterium]
MKKYFAVNLNKEMTEKELKKMLKPLLTVTSVEEAIEILIKTNMLKEL